MNIIQKAWLFYYEGFKNISYTGKKLWFIILIKLFIMFVILRLFFFPDVMKEKFDSDEERSNHIIEELTNH